MGLNSSLYNDEDNYSIRTKNALTILAGVSNEYYSKNNVSLLITDQ